jgi:hypothetical protein
MGKRKRFFIVREVAASSLSAGQIFWDSSYAAKDGRERSGYAKKFVKYESPFIYYTEPNCSVVRVDRREAGESLYIGKWEREA